MVRNDNLASASMSSAAQRRADAQRLRRQTAAEEKAAVVTPSAQIIMDWIDQEIVEVCDLRHMVIHAADKELARDELIARKLHLDFLEKLKGRAGKMVRVADRRDKAAVKEAVKLQMDADDA